MLLMFLACNRRRVPIISSPSRTIAAASGWSLIDSTAMATFSRSSICVPPTGITSVMRGRPSVRVPVLSNAMAFKEPSSSSGAPPLISTPPRAALAMPDRMALGVAIASAQGLAATSTAIAR